MDHKYYFEDILKWIVHGIKQFALYWIPLLDPSPEYGSPPGFWLDFYTSSAWYNHIDSNYIPDATWISYWMRASWLTLFAWIVEIGQFAINDAVDWVRSFTGWLQHGYATFAQWLDAIRTRVGTWIPAWTSDLASGLQFVWNLFPYEVREAIHTFGEHLDNALDGLYARVLRYYEQTVADVEFAVSWIVSAGAQIRSWYFDVRDTINAFVDDPGGYIKQRLGTVWDWVVAFWNNPRAYVETLLEPWWTRLYVFARDCLNYWYDVWGIHAQTLSNFLAAPLAWLYDRVEDELISRW